MSAGYGQPLSVVSQADYERERAGRFQLDRLEPEEEYTARLIIDPSTPDAYGADFLVIVNEIIRPRQRLFAWMGSKAIKVSLSPINPDTNQVSETETVENIKESGMLYRKEYAFLNTVSLEKGYFLNARDDGFDRELAEILSQPIEGPKVMLPS